jgi:hypothetical protein
MYKMAASFSTRRNVRRGANIVRGVGILGLGSLAATKGFQAARNMRLYETEREAALAEQEAEYSANLYRDARFTGWQRKGMVYGRRLLGIARPTRLGKPWQRNGMVYGRKLGQTALGAGVAVGLGAVGGYAAGHTVPLKDPTETLHYPTDVYSDYAEYT